MSWGLKSWGTTFSVFGKLFKFRIGSRPFISILGFKFGPKGQRR